MIASEGESASSVAARAAEAERILARFFMSAHITSFLPGQAGARKTTALPSWACSSTSWHLPASHRVVLWKPPRVLWGSSGTHAEGD